MNVLVRFLTDDDKAQTDRVRRFLSECRSASELVYVSAIVLCEAVWVLRSVFGKSRSEILGALEQLLEADIFQIEESEAVRRALQSSKIGKADFADHLIGQLNLERGCRFTVTFDRALRRASGFSVL